MAKKQPATLPANISGTLPGFDVVYGVVSQLENGDWQVRVRPPRKKFWEQTVYPASRVKAALTGEEGWIVMASPAVEILGVDVLPDTAESVEGGTQYDTEAGEALFVAGDVATSLTCEVTDEEEEAAPATKKKSSPAKTTKGKAAVEDDEDEDDEEEEEEEETPKAKSKSKEKAPAKGKKKPVVEDDEDEDEDDEEEEEEETPKTKSKDKKKSTPAKGKKKPADEDDEDEDDEDEDDELDF